MYRDRVRESELDEFKKNHPGVTRYLPYIIAVYAECRVLRGLNPLVSYEEKFMHIFKRKGGCKRCKERMKDLIRPKRIKTSSSFFALCKSCLDKLGWR